MWFHSKGCIFQCIIVFSSPAVVRILVGRLDSCFLTHIKKYMTPIHALIFEKTRQIVWNFILDRLKSQCKLIILWRSTCSKISWLGGHFFQNSGLQGPGRVSPAGSLRRAPLIHYFMLFWGLMGFNYVVKAPHKSQCNNYSIW